MIKQKIASILFTLLTVFLCASLLSGCRRIQRIEEDQVERIVVWNHTTEHELTQDESARFVALYNASQYGGKKIVGESTPDFGIRVYFRDGTILHATDALGKLRVGFSNADWIEKTWNYVNSEALYDFVSELAEKI